MIYCGDCLDQLRKLPDGRVDRLYLWHRFPTDDSHSRRNYEVFRGETEERRVCQQSAAMGTAKHEQDV